MSTIIEQAVALAIEEADLIRTCNTLQMVPLLPGRRRSASWQRQYRDASDKSIQVGKDLRALEEQMTAEEGIEAVRLYEARFKGEE